MNYVPSATMNIKVALVSPALALTLAGCGVADIAQNAAQVAADATACKALNSTIKSITTAYESGLIDSGLISQIDNLVGDQARALLSTGLAQDITLLTETLGQTQTAEGSRDAVREITDSISKRCSEVGVNIK